MAPLVAAKKIAEAAPPVKKVNAASPAISMPVAIRGCSSTKFVTAFQTPLAPSARHFKPSFALVAHSLSPSFIELPIYSPLQ